MRRAAGMSCQMSEMPVKVLKVLLVDDDEDDFMITKDTLSNSEVLEFDIEWVNTYDGALPVMLENRHDVCLIDYRLGMRNGLDLMKETISRGSTIPKILVTGQGDQLVDYESMRAGAADYLVKGCYDKALLERSIRYAVEHHCDAGVAATRTGTSQIAKNGSRGPPGWGRRARVEQPDDRSPGKR